MDENLAKEIQGNFQSTDCRGITLEQIKQLNIVEPYCFESDNKTQLMINDEYELKQEGDAYYIVRKETQYPKTYKECCDVLSLPLYYNLRYYTYEHGYNEYATSNNLLSLQDKLNTLGKLIICRNAYWKIAGEQMGLDKSWEPDWTNHEFKHCIKVMGNTLECISEMNIQCILAFPTQKMRDAFFENFKELIEQCKELL